MSFCRFFNILLLASVVGVFGCGSGGATPSAPAAASDSAESTSTGGDWWGLVLTQVRVATGATLQLVHDGTGWVLGKNKITIEQLGPPQEKDGKQVATYRVTVVRADETFTSEIADVEVDELGIPTEQSQAKMDEAVSRIKQLLDKLQQ